MLNVPISMLKVSGNGLPRGRGKGKLGGKATWRWVGLSGRGARRRGIELFCMILSPAIYQRSQVGFCRPHVRVGVAYYFSGVIFGRCAHRH